MPRTRRLLLTSSLLALTACLAPGLAAQTLFPRGPGTGITPSAPVDTKGEFVMGADEVTYDRNTETVTARGHVQISQGGRTLTAQTLSYNRRSELVTASGNIVLHEPNGDVLFGEYAEITKDMREGIIRDFRALLADNSRFAANGARRTEGNRTELAQMVFSPCDLCPTDPNRAPAWQLRARRAVHDEPEKQVRYRDVTLEAFGIPVFYTPYFAHPDATAKRQSGFMAPTAGTFRKNGYVVGIPYYGVIDDQSDFQIQPTIYTAEGAALAGEYRRRFSFGRIRAVGSLADVYTVKNGVLTSNKGLRGHYGFTGEAALDENWRIRANVLRFTDSTYTRRYRVDSTYLVGDSNFFLNQIGSNVAVDGFYNRSYVTAEAMAIQSLAIGANSRVIPKIHPYVYAEHYFPSFADGSYVKVSPTLLSLTRQDGVGSHRFSTVSGWYKPFVGKYGDVWNIAATLQTDAYAYRNVTDPGNSGRTVSGDLMRAHPQFSANVRYPLINRIGSNSLLVEPIVGVVFGPNGNNDKRIPNEDSLSFEFDETNLFSVQRFPGRDRIASGSRVDYGVQIAALGDNGGSASAFVGQSWQQHVSSAYPVGSGLDRNLSDLVGRVTIAPRKWYDLTYRFRVDSKTWETNRDEIQATLYRGQSYLSASYIQFSAQAIPTIIPAREALSLGGAMQVTNTLSLSGAYNYDLVGNKPLGLNLAALYRDECTAAMVVLYQDYVTNRDLKRGTTIMFRWALKYLGDFGG